jgi:flagellar biosynthesis protein FlhA
MAIEAEFNSGNITIEEATRRRAAMQQAIDFYGAMDGPSKFAGGSVKAGIFVTVASIIGSIIIGLCLNREPLFDVMSGVYMRFSIGNGIFFQFTLMLILTAMGIAVGRTVSAGDFGER